MLGVASLEPAGVPATPAECSALDLSLAPLRPILDDPQVTELCINRPGEAQVQTYAGWSTHALPYADFDWCLALAKLVGSATRQHVSEVHPLLSARLPSGERVQFVLPPATLARHVSITIRRPGARVRTLDELDARGLFRGCAVAGSGLEAEERELLALHAAGRFAAFLRLAVKLRKNVIVSGSTGTGKTTATNALILEVPESERLVTIEDAEELVLPRHPNHVRLFYSKDDQGLAKVTPTKLLEATLRMRPDRVFLSELRSDEAFEYLRVIAAHPGSITSVHGSSAHLALVQLLLLVKQSEAGQSLSTEDVWRLLYSLVDVVVQFAFDGAERVVREIWYDPQRRRTA
ncbi:MAG: P-type DNA transfer ATPase VirB11 [Burkholderiales bacterium]|jgi:type IV secretion system protein VirB11|nr:P-type DNA transfer ATPase VirB11 [Burkholderiales bacterium]